MSREDTESMLEVYMTEAGITTKNPFETLDRKGVGEEKLLLRRAGGLAGWLLTCAFVDMKSLSCFVCVLQEHSLTWPLDCSASKSLARLPLPQLVSVATRLVGMRGMVQVDVCLCVYFTFYIFAVWCMQGTPCPSTFLPLWT